MKRSIAVACFALVALVSCRKEKEEAVDNTVARDNSTSEVYFNDLLKVVDDVANSTEGIRGDGLGCIDELTVDTESSPMTMMIDFGSDNCVGSDGRIRKGKIYVTFTGRYRDEGTVITITPDNYSVNGYLIEGQKVVTNLGPDENGHLHFSVNVNGTLTAPGGAYTTQWSAQRVRTWLEGSETYTIWDDVYEITGSGSGTNRFGAAYTILIVSPLRIEIGCPWIVSGGIRISPQQAAVRTLNFGSGDCNEGFTVEVNGNSYAINGGN